MRLALLALQKSLDFTWVEIDIDRETDLIRLYDSLVPVFHYQDWEVCHFFIDEAEIRRIITDCNG